MTDNGDRWGSLVTLPLVSGQIAQCVQGQIDGQIAAAQPVNVDSIVKNPDGVKGQVFVMVTSITQYDAATGACAFRGRWDTQDHQYSFDFVGDNAYFDAGDGLTTCPVLNGIDQNDVVRVWAQSEGSYSYATQIGGNTTVPKFKILKAELIRKA